MNFSSVLRNHVINKLNFSTNFNVSHSLQLFALSVTAFIFVFCFQEQQIFQLKKYASSSINNSNDYSLTLSSHKTKLVQNNNYFIIIRESAQNNNYSIILRKSAQSCNDSLDDSLFFSSCSFHKIKLMQNNSYSITLRESAQHCSDSLDDLLSLLFFHSCRIKALNNYVQLKKEF